MAASASARSASRRSSGAEAEALREQEFDLRAVTKSYWPGLFACYGSADIPRTNNDLEHLFGSGRSH